MKTWQDVPGWLTDNEGTTLQRLATGARVLEIGAYMGRSTCAMGKTAESVTSVDHHKGDAHTGPVDTFRDFLANLEACGVVDKVNPIVAAIDEVNWSFTAGKFDLVFVDGAHDPVSVERDTRIAMLAVRPGGVIAWHDWNWETVRQGVWACGLTPFTLADNLVWLVMP